MSDKPPVSTLTGFPVIEITDNKQDISPVVEVSTGRPIKENRRRRFLIVLLVAAFVIVFYLVKKNLGFDVLVERETALKNFYAENPATVLASAFLIYVITVGLSIPGAMLMSLIYAWFFGFTYGVVLISFASTAGATLAFLMSRYLFRDLLQDRFRERLSVFNKALDAEGAYYLFTLRLIPVVPFFITNAVMGLTRMKIVTFWWVSQLGMILGTILFVYAGSRIPDLRTLQNEGVKSVFTPSQLFQISIAFALIGLVPIVIKTVIRRRRSGNL